MITHWWTKAQIRVLVLNDPPHDSFAEGQLSSIGVDSVSWGHTVAITKLTKGLNVEDSLDESGEMLTDEAELRRLQQ